MSWWRPTEKDSPLRYAAKLTALLPLGFVVLLLFPVLMMLMLPLVPLLGYAHRKRQQQNPQPPSPDVPVQFAPEGPVVATHVTTDTSGDPSTRREVEA